MSISRVADLGGRDTEAWAPALPRRRGRRWSSRLMESGFFPQAMQGAATVPQTLFVSCRFAVTVLYITECPHGQVSPC